MKKNGFTLLEVIIGIAILTIAVAGVMGLMTQTLVYASSNQSKLIASYLAQEGLELVRNKRDDNWLKQRWDNSVDWRTGLQEAGNNRAWEVDYTTTTLTMVKTGPTPHQYNVRYLYISSTTGFYYYPNPPDSNNPPPPDAIQTNFKRLIQISDGSDDSYFTVTVTVSWVDRGKTYSVTAETILYNWYGS